MRILIVEDDEDCGEALMQLLLEKGHEVRLVMDPVQAPEVSLGFQPHVAILDIGLPVISGFELIALLRALPELGSCSYISVTAYAEAEAARRSAQAGFRHHLIKPFPVRDLLAHLQQVTAQNDS